jgi:hypothetical protein
MAQTELIEYYPKMRFCVVWFEHPGAVQNP